MAMSTKVEKCKMHGKHMSCRSKAPTSHSSKLARHTAKEGSTGVHNIDTYPTIRLLHRLRPSLSLSARFCDPNMDGQRDTFSAAVFAALHKASVIIVPDTSQYVYARISEQQRAWPGIKPPGLVAS